MKHSSYVQKLGKAGRLLQSIVPLAAADAAGAADDAITLAGFDATPLLAGTLATLCA